MTCCRSAFTFLHCSIGRGDDMRLIRLSHLVRPIRLRCVGPIPCFIVAGVLAGNKTQKVRSACMACMAGWLVGWLCMGAAANS